MEPVHHHAEGGPADGESQRSDRDRKRAIARRPETRAHRAAASRRSDSVREHLHQGTGLREVHFASESSQGVAGLGGVFGPRNLFRFGVDTFEAIDFFPVPSRFERRSGLKSAFLLLCLSLPLFAQPIRWEVHPGYRSAGRSEEHTSELQSLAYLV